VRLAPAAARHARRYHLQDYWEDNMWNVTNYIDTVPPVAQTEAMGLWEMGNLVISGDAHDSYMKVL
jgi:hypothetical protein